MWTRSIISTEPGLQRYIWAHAVVATVVTLVMIVRVGGEEGRGWQGAYWQGMAGDGRGGGERMAGGLLAGDADYVGINSSCGATDL